MVGVGREPGVRNQQLWNRARDGVGRTRRRRLCDQVCRSPCAVRGAFELPVNISATSARSPCPFHGARVGQLPRQKSGTGSRVTCTSRWSLRANLRASAGLQFKRVDPCARPLGTWKWRPQLIPRPGPFPFQMPASRRIDFIRLSDFSADVFATGCSFLRSSPWHPH